MTRCDYLPCNCAPDAPKSPVELHLFPKPLCRELGRGEGEGAGDTELLLCESECREPFDWCMALFRCASVDPVTVERRRTTDSV